MEMHAFILLSLYFEDARWLLICGRKSMKVPEQVEEPLAEMCSVCCNVFYKNDFSLTSVDCRNAPCFSRQCCWQVQWKKTGAQCSGTVALAYKWITFTNVQLTSMLLLLLQNTDARSAFSC